MTTAPPRPLLLPLAASLLLWHALPLPACDVPVCDYALRYWSRSDYTVYYLPGGSDSAGDAAANDLLRRVAAGEEGHANLRFVVLDAGRLATGLTPQERAVLDAHPAAPRPRHVLVSPSGVTLYSGRLSADEVRGLLASVRTRTLSELLCGGARGVVLLLTDGDEAAIGTARAAVGAALAAAPEAARPALVELSRQDPAEQWLVRQLLAVEPDLPTLRSPMAFGVYGRCHVTEPYLGRGITEANLTVLAKFLNGPCTCEIKEAHRGVDLLSNCDWAAHVPEAGAPPRPADGGGYVEFDQ